MKRAWKVLAAAVALTAAVSSAGSAQVRAGFNGTGFPGNDDGSTGPVAVGFTLNFFGSLYNNVYVNNNGNITFTGGMSTYTPFPIVTTGVPMIAPFFADVDTRVGPWTAYGAGAVGGHNAWGVTWNGVCFYSMDCNNTNTFQLVLVDRSDVGAGDFDIEFNYAHIGWEAGQASGSDGNGRGGACARAAARVGANVSSACGFWPVNSARAWRARPIDSPSASISTRDCAIRPSAWRRSTTVSRPAAMRWRVIASTWSRCCCDWIATSRASMRPARLK